MAVLLAPVPASACFLRDFDISVQPSVPAANEPFELVVDYQGSEGCILSESLFVTDPVLRVEIDCNCPFTATSPVSQQFMASVPGLEAGQHPVSVFALGSPAPVEVASAIILIGHAPSIPVSPLALTLLTLTLALAAVWVLRR